MKYQTGARGVVCNDGAATAGIIPGMSPAYPVRGISTGLRDQGIAGLPRLAKIKGKKKVKKKGKVFAMNEVIKTGARGVVCNVATFTANAWSEAARAASALAREKSKKANNLVGSYRSRDGSVLTFKRKPNEELAKAHDEASAAHMAAAGHYERAWAGRYETPAPANAHREKAETHARKARELRSKR